MSKSIIKVWSTFLFVDFPKSCGAVYISRHISQRQCVLKNRSHFRGHFMVHLFPLHSVLSIMRSPFVVFSPLLAALATTCTASVLQPRSALANEVAWGRHELLPSLKRDVPPGCTTTPLACSACPSGADPNKKGFCKAAKLPGSDITQKTPCSCVEVQLVTVTAADKKTAVGTYRATTLSQYKPLTGRTTVTQTATVDGSPTDLALVVVAGGAAWYLMGKCILRFARLHDC